MLLGEAAPDADLAIALEPLGTARSAPILKPRHAICTARFPTAAADGRHVLAILAHGDATLSARGARLARVELVRRSLLMRGTPALAGDLPLLGSVHGGKSAIATRTRRPLAAGRSRARLRGEPIAAGRTREAPTLVRYFALPFPIRAEALVIVRSDRHHCYLLKSLGGRPVIRVQLCKPRNHARMLQRAEDCAVDRLAFPLEVTELEPGQNVARKDYAIVPYAADHRGARALGFAVVEEIRKGRFNPDRARELGVPEGPLWGEIHRGRPVTLDDGRVIDPSELVGAPRAGRKVVITGDTRPCQGTIDAARDADVLVHEATFGDEEAERAVETGHSTAREAAIVARDANVGTLVLVHFSARYSRDASDLGKEAREVFENTAVGKDGMEIDVPYRVTPVSAPEPASTDRAG